MKFSKNDRAESLMGKRPEGYIAIDSPSELGYRCPVCNNQSDGDYDERLEWSEYNSFIWCSVCNRDYPSCLCTPDISHAIDVFLSSVDDAITRRTA